MVFLREAVIAELVRLVVGFDDVFDDGSRLPEGDAGVGVVNSYAT